MTKEFFVTSEHLKLLPRLCWGWQDCEYGAPEVDPKRPYGNSSVERDILEILGVSLPSGDWDDDYTTAQKEYAEKLHREIQTCLEILSSNLGISLGMYVIKSGSWGRA